MRITGNAMGRAALLLAAFLWGTTWTYAQGNQRQQPQSATQQQQPQLPANQQVAPLTLDSTPPPVNAEEEAAIKAFRDETTENGDKKVQLAQDFLQKYPQSRYRPEIYNYLVREYYRKSEIDKMEQAADKQLELYPNDPQTLAIVGATLPRAMTSSTPEPQKRLAKAEEYCHKALDLLPTIPKPDNMTDEVFQKLKKETSAMAYSGLGLVAYRRGKYAEAIPNFEQSVKLDSQPDPVNYYLLGMSNEKTSHFEDAVAAFGKCAAIPSVLQTTCAQNVEEAKKLATTQLSAPK